MSSNEGHNNIRIPRTPLSPPQFAKLREEGKENVIWKWENNYLIITFNTEARITACTVSALQYSTVQGYQDTLGPSQGEGQQATNDMMVTRDNNYLFSSLKILQ